jgi:transposase-like protein
VRLFCADAVSDFFQRPEVVSALRFQIPTMPRSNPASIEPPICPKCKGRMLMTRLVPDAEAELQTFECGKCGRTQQIEKRSPLHEREKTGSRDLQATDDHEEP